MARNDKIALFLVLAIVGGIGGIWLSRFVLVGSLHNTAPSMERIIAGTVIVTIAVAWACFFAIRMHFAQDEFRRQREISASYWGYWFGIVVSAPIVFFVAVGGLGPLAVMHVQPSVLFAIGYVLSPICTTVGMVGARLWLHRRDSKQ